MNLSFSIAPRLLIELNNNRSYIFCNRSTKRRRRKRKRMEQSVVFSFVCSIDQSFILVIMMRSLVGNDIENKRQKFTLSQNHFRPFFILSWPFLLLLLLLFYLCSLLLLALLFIAITNSADARAYACLHRALIFFASVKKSNIEKLEETFFFIFFRSAVCFLEFSLSFSSITTTKYYYHKR